MAVTRVFRDRSTEARNALLAKVSPNFFANVTVRVPTFNPGEVREPPEADDMNESVSHETSDKTIVGL